MKKQKEFVTIREYLYWIYSNIGLAHVAIKNGHEKYQTFDYMIRAKLYKGLCDGTMNISTLYNDEKQKLLSDTCCYCGDKTPLTLDHLIPKSKGGSDSGDNLVYACKICNSSKNNRDMIAWKLERCEFPPILTLRRYIKLAYEHFKENMYLDVQYADLQKFVLIYRIDLIPYEFPEPALLKL